MSILAPESRRATMSIMNLGSGMSTFIGPAIAGVFLPLGVSGVMWLFALCTSSRLESATHYAYLVSQRCNKAIWMTRNSVVQG